MARPYYGILVWLTVVFEQEAYMFSYLFIYMLYTNFFVFLFIYCLRNGIFSDSDYKLHDVE
jgi:hypothetical protein